jgi:hypothetical protein
MATLITDLIKQSAPTYNDGDILAAQTQSVGFAPSILDTVNYVNGVANYKVVGVGTPTSGVYPEYHIVPMVNSSDNTSLVADTANPVIIQKAGTVIYTTGRNDVNSKDVYHDRSYGTVTSITSGQETKVALQHFLQFVQSEYSIGVMDWTVSGADQSTYTD